MVLRDYCFDGDRKLVLKDMPTGAGVQKENKEELVAKTRKNMAQAAELQEKMYASNTEAIKSLQEKVKSLEISNIQNSNENQFLKKKIEDLEKNIKALASENELKGKRNKAEISNILKICRNTK